jgi:hypothetical protein
MHADGLRVAYSRYTPILRVADPPLSACVLTPACACVISCLKSSAESNTRALSPPTPPRCTHFASSTRAPEQPHDLDASWMIFDFARSLRRQLARQLALDLDLHPVLGDLLDLLDRCTSARKSLLLFSLVCLVFCLVFC